MYVIFDELTQEEFNEQFLELLKKSDLTLEQEDFEFMYGTANYYLERFNTYLRHHTGIKSINESEHYDDFICFDECCDYFIKSIDYSISHEQSLFIQLMSFKNFLNNRERERRRGLLNNETEKHIKRVEENKAKKLKPTAKYIRLCRLYKLWKENENVSIEMIDREIVYTFAFQFRDDFALLKELGFDKSSAGNENSLMKFEKKPQGYNAKNKSIKEIMLQKISRLLIIMDEFPIFLERQKDESNPEHSMTLEELYLGMFEGATVEDMEKDLGRLRFAGIDYMMNSKEPTDKGG